MKNVGGKNTRLIVLAITAILLTFSSNSFADDACGCQVKSSEGEFSSKDFVAARFLGKVVWQSSGVIFQKYQLPTTNSTINGGCPVDLAQLKPIETFSAMVQTGDVGIKLNDAAAPRVEGETYPISSAYGRDLTGLVFGKCEPIPEPEVY